MLSIRLKAAEVKKILSADTPEKAQSALAPVVEAIKVAEVAKSFGKPAKAEGLTYKRAHEILSGILGDALVVPAAPDGAFFAKANRAIRLHAMDETYVQRLAEYCKVNMRPGLEIDFVLGQAPRILAGTWSKNKSRAQTIGTPAQRPVWRQDTLPED